MGNQGKIAKKQSGKMYIYLHISILRFIFERKLILGSSSNDNDNAEDDA